MSVARRLLDAVYYLVGQTGTFTMKFLEGHGVFPLAAVKK